MKSYPCVCVFVCEEFTPYAFDAYDPEMIAQAAMGNGDRGPLAQRREFTIDQLTLVCLKLKLGKSACRDGFCTDFWHKVAVRLVGENTNTNTKYTCDTGQTRNKLLAQ